jgi:aldehyde:ferredoxin oxidoreductase
MARADEDLGIKPFKRHDGAIKAANVARHQDWSGIYNALVQCVHSNVPVSDMVDLVNFTTDFDYSLEVLMRVGERSWNLRRVINYKLGMSREDDRLPEILMKPFPDGGSAGYVIPIEEMLEAYYEAREWDPVTGKPKPHKLVELGLSSVIKDVWK